MKDFLNSFCVCFFSLIEKKKKKLKSQFYVKTNLSICQEQEEEL